MQILITHVDTDRVNDNSVIREKVADMYCSHEEADRRMFFSCREMFFSCQHRCCLIIILGCKHLYDRRLKIRLEDGKDSRNNQRYININQLHENLGEKLCRTLPAYHALTGCDYTASFNRKGKVKPLKVLQKY